MRRFLVGLVVVLAIVAGTLWYVAGRLDDTEITPNVHMLSGVGGNVGVLTTPEGVVVVDTMMLVRQGNAVRDRIRDFTDEPVVTVLNTHYHVDHTHGNPAFPVGTKVVSTGRTLQHLHELDADFWKDHPAIDLLPNDTFDGASKEMTIGGKTIRLVHPGRGHTDGDMVVLFVEDRVLHAGDLFFHGHYPNIDLEAGGSVREWPATLDKVLELPFDKVIPGHGPATTRVALERFRDFMATLWEETVRVRDKGGSLADAEQLVDLEPFGLKPIWFAPMLNRRFVIGRSWEEATASGGPRG